MAGIRALSCLLSYVDGSEVSRPSLLQPLNAQLCPTPFERSAN